MTKLLTMTMTTITSTMMMVVVMAMTLMMVNNDKDDDIGNVIVSFPIRRFCLSKHRFEKLIFLKRRPASDFSNLPLQVFAFVFLQFKHRNFSQYIVHINSLFFLISDNDQAGRPL